MFNILTAKLKKRGIKKEIILMFLILSTMTFAEKKLILIQLKGGNDGLNTVVPYSEKEYYENRKSIALKESELIRIDDKLALNKNLENFSRLLKSDDLAIINGVGYEPPNRSHFTSTDIISLGDVSRDLVDGWVATAFKSNKVASPFLDGVVLEGRELSPLTNYGDGYKSITINSIDEMISSAKTLNASSSDDKIAKSRENIRSIGKTLEERKSKNSINLEKVEGEFKNQGRTLLELAALDLDIPVYKMQLGGFDTHQDQDIEHPLLLKELDETVAYLEKELKKSGNWDDTLILVYTEFGRRVKENGTSGTDHGTSTPYFLIGGKVKGGIYGDYPSLDKLDKNGDLEITTDFRKIYSTIIESWFNFSNNPFSKFGKFQNLIEK